MERQLLAPVKRTSQPSKDQPSVSESSQRNISFARRKGWLAARVETPCRPERTCYSTGSRPRTLEHFLEPDFFQQEVSDQPSQPRILLAQLVELRSLFAFALLVEQLLLMPLR